jgi:hypothetical protein
MDGTTSTTSTIYLPQHLLPIHHYMHPMDAICTQIIILSMTTLLFRVIPRHLLLLLSEKLFHFLV